eukprot:1178599-Prorocentrum_minimum.AAC.2
MSRAIVCMLRATVLSDHPLGSCQVARVDDELSAGVRAHYPTMIQPSAHLAPPAASLAPPAAQASDLLYVVYRSVANPNRPSPNRIDQLNRILEWSY